MNGSLLLYLALAYPAFYVLYFLVIALAGRLYRPPQFRAEQPPGRFAILIAAYAEDEVILSTVQHCLDHDYPADRFHLFLAVEGHQPETLRCLRELPVHIEETKGKKGEALCRLLQAVEEGFDQVLILDADNRMAPGCLRAMNAALQGGARVVQGQRQAKNADTHIAVLDGLSEAINNHLFRRGQNAVGLSASLIGSGMAFERRLLERILPEVKGIWEDRELELRILSKGVKIHYLEEAVVYDEKVSRAEVFVQQRSKWVGGQFLYLRPTVLTCLRGGCSPDLLNKVLHALAPPRSVLLGLLLLLLVGCWLAGSGLPQALGLTALLLLTFLLALPNALLNRRTLGAAFSLPLLLAMMFVIVPLSVVRRRQHYHTPHVVK